MSPAPIRTRSAGSLQKFPGSWGYGLGAMLMVAGVAVGLVLVVGGLQGFADDVRDLRRAVDTDNLELSLEEGEYLVFDEDGLDLGPFNATVTRTSDGRDIPTSGVNDGTSYDVDGRRGTARLGFRVPTSDIYRVELDTSVGDVLKFAVGSDVGNSRANAITRGVLFGTILFGIGALAIIITLFRHARWRLRTQLADGADRARAAVGRVEELADPGEIAKSTTRRGASFGRDRLGKARQVLDDVGSGEQAGAAIDGLEQQLEALEPALMEVAEAVPAPADLADRIDQALGRVQDRLSSGDRLRDIARDEATVAKETAADVAAQVQATRDTAIEQAGAVGEAVLDNVSRQLPPPLPSARPEPPPSLGEPQPELPPPLLTPSPNPLPEPQPEAQPGPSERPLGVPTLATAPKFAALAPPPVRAQPLAAATRKDRPPTEPGPADEPDPSTDPEGMAAARPLDSGLTLAPPPDYSRSRLKAP